MPKVISTAHSPPSRAHEVDYVDTSGTSTTVGAHLDRLAGLVALPYGDDTTRTATAFAFTAGDVQFSFGRGYVLPSGGRIVGHSASLEATDGLGTVLDIRVKVNNATKTALTLGLSLSSIDDVSDYVSVSPGEAVSAGDIITVDVIPTTSGEWANLQGAVFVKLEL